MPTFSARHFIVGAGLAGSASAWQLTCRGEEFVVLECSQPANLLRSSHDPARIFRYVYPGIFPRSPRDRSETRATALCRDTGHRGRKVAEYNGDGVIPAVKAQNGLVADPNTRRVTEYVHDLLPGLSPDPYAETICYFTNRPAEGFLIDRIEGITLVFTSSGQGAKLAPTIGRMAADIALGPSAMSTRFRADILVANEAA